MLLCVVGVPIEYAVDGATRDAVGTCQLTQTLPALAIAEDGLAIEIERPPADGASFEAGAPHAGPNTLGDIPRQAKQNQSLRDVRTKVAITNLKIFSNNRHLIRGEKRLEPAPRT